MARKKGTRSPPLARPATPEQLRAIASGNDEALDIIRLKRRYGVKGDATIYSWVKAGILPKPIRISGSSRWLVSQIGAAA